jgi:hypothetical protein
MRDYGGYSPLDYQQEKRFILIISYMEINR